MPTCSAATSAASSLFNKALDVLEPLQTKALDAIDASLGEFEPDPSGPPTLSSSEAASLWEQWEQLQLDQQRKRYRQRHHRLCPSS